jgi:hypothetical protein
VTLATSILLKAVRTFSYVRVASPWLTREAIRLTPKPWATRNARDAPFRPAVASMASARRCSALRRVSGSLPIQPHGGITLTTAGDGYSRSEPRAPPRRYCGPPWRMGDRTTADLTELICVGSKGESGRHELSRTPEWRNIRVFPYWRLLAGRAVGPLLGHVGSGSELRPRRLRQRMRDESRGRVKLVDQPHAGVQRRPQ